MLSNLVDNFCLKRLYKLLKISTVYFHVLHIHTMYLLTEQQTNRQDKTASLLMMHQKPYDFNSNFPANIYLFKFNNRNTRKRCKICLKLTAKTPERRH